MKLLLACVIIGMISPVAAAAGETDVRVIIQIPCLPFLGCTDQYCPPRCPTSEETTVGFEVSEPYGVSVYVTVLP